MQHDLRLSSKEKIEIWLDLCDFSFKLMRAALSKRELKKRLNQMRRAHLEDDYLILSKLAKLK